MMCYVEQARELRAAMAGSPDATSLPAPTSQGSTALTNAAEIFREIAGDVEAGLRDAEAAHYGRAADAAKASIAEIKPIADHAAHTADKVKGALDDQANSQNTTFKALPQEGGTLPDGKPAQMRPPEKNWADEHGMGWTWWGSGYEEKQARFQATNAEAGQVMRAYSNQTEGIAGRTPSFKPPESAPPPGPAPATYGQSASSAMAGSSYSSTPSMGGSAPSGTSSAWAGSPSGGGGYTPAPTPSSQVPAGSGSAWIQGGNGALPPGTVRGPDGTLYRQGPNGQWMRQNPHNGRWAPVPPGQGPGGGRTGSGAGAGGRAAGGAGGAGGRAGGGFGPRGSGGSGLAPGGQSGRGGFGPSGSAPAASSASSSSSGGRGGGMMRGMGGGGQQQGGEEEDHERPSWLVETEDVFTNDMERVAPPVLGALPDEQQGR